MGWVLKPEQCCIITGFCYCFTTKTGSVIIATFKLFYSCIVTTSSVIYLIFTLLGQTEDYVEWGILLYVLLVIGSISGILHIVMVIMLIRGVVKRRPRLVYSYLMFSLVGLLLTLAATVVAMFSINLVTVARILTGIFALELELYFLLVVYSEYRVIQREKENTANGDHEQQV